MKDQQRKKVPPDGGWGYAVVLATAVMAFLAVPVYQNFGLLFRPIFSELEFTASEIVTIINVNSGAGYIFGIFHGPLCKIFGYRIYAMIGVMLFSIGLLVSSLSHTVFMIMIFYGILNSIGFCITSDVFTFSLNSYFAKNRTTAVGVAYTIGGVGSILTPLVLSQGINHFGARYTACIQSAIALNLLAAAMLLQPVKWHHKYEDELQELRNIKPEALIEKESDQKRFKTKENGSTAEKTSLKSDVETFEDEKIDKKKPKKGCLRYIARWFDLDLLRDPVFVSIFIGLSFALAGETMFSLMYPIILGDKGFDITDTGAILSTTACVDIVFRIIVPLAERLLKWKTRDMYMLTLIMLITSRFMLTLVDTYRNAMLVAAFIGIAKGFRTVYMMIVIANYVPIEKLPSAQGIQTLSNGVMLLATGPLVGIIRDYYGNFEVVVHLTNFMSLIALSIWGTERLVMKVIGGKSKGRTATS